MNTIDIVRQRLYTQRLSGHQLATPEAVVQWLGAVQSQDYPGAKWSVGQRVRQCKDADVEQAFTEGKILRTHVLRPTWHFVAPADIRWILQLTAPRVHALNAYQYRSLELDDELFVRAHALFEQELAGGKQLTRLELARLLAGIGIVADKLRLAYIVMHAELEGLICSGAVRGKQHTYALLEERAPNAKHLDHDEALAELTRRFFAGHGPATLKDFGRWSSLSSADIQAGLEMTKQHLAHEVVEGETYWFSASMTPAPPAEPRAYLLSEYDECYLSYKTATMPDLAWTIPYDRWNDVWYRPVIINMQRAGTWRRTVAKSGITLETNLFTTLDAEQTQLLHAAAERYGEYMGAAVRVAT